HTQSLQINYDLPFSKFPFLKFIRATYSYTGDYQWQKSSNQFNELPIELTSGETQTYNLGNSIQNGSTHKINSSLDMNTLYRYVGLTKITKSKPKKSASGDGNAQDDESNEGDGKSESEKSQTDEGGLGLIARSSLSGSRDGS